MTLEGIEPFGPEAFVFVHPICDQAKRLRTKRNEDLAASLFPLNQSGALEQFEVFRDCVERHIKRFGNVQEASRSARQSLDNFTPGRVRNGAQDVG